MTDDVFGHAPAHRGSPAAAVPGKTTRSDPRYDHAVVLGAGMAGLTTAQALSRHFRRVTIVERDVLPGRLEHRAGVPQAHHLHVMLTGGADAIEQLLPGFADGLIAAGAVEVRLPTDMLWLNPAGWVKSVKPLHRLLSASRSLIEWHTRQLLCRTPGITVVDGRNVLGLCLSMDRRRVTGITLGATGGDGVPDAVETLDADLVVDATGRRSRLPDWFTRLGLERPAETRIDAHLAYSTRIYRRPAGDRDWKAIFLQADPNEVTRMAVMFPIEGDRWMVTLQGVGADKPPTTSDGFLHYARGLRSTVLHDALRDAEPLTDPIGWANTANLRHHYERLRAMPDRLLVVGDSACSFNPVYGQGISVAAKTAIALDRQLAKHGRRRRALDGFTRQMQRVVAKEGAAAWMIATGDDLRLPGTTGAKESAAARFQHRYLDRVLAASTVDDTVLAAVAQAFLLLRPPTVLFRPNVVARAALHGGRPNTEPRPVDVVPPVAVAPIAPVAER